MHDFLLILVGGVIGAFVCHVCIRYQPAPGPRSCVVGSSRYWYALQREWRERYGIEFQEQSHAVQSALERNTGA
jgi:hypothetical protein